MGIFLNRVASCLVAVCVMATASEMHAEEIRVLATGSTMKAMKTIIPAYQSGSGNVVHIEYGPSYGISPEALPSRMDNGEQADLVLMIGPALDQQIARGKLDGDSRADVAASTIGIAVRPGAAPPEITTVDELKTALLGARTIAISEGASGKYILDALFGKLGIADELRRKTLITRNGELVGSVLMRGDADIAMQQNSELKIFPGITYVGSLPDAVQQRSPVSAAVVSSSSKKKSALDFLNFLQRPFAVKAFDDSGLDRASVK